MSHHHILLRNWQKYCLDINYQNIIVLKLDEQKILIKVFFFLYSTKV